MAALSSALQPWHGNHQQITGRSGGCSSRFAAGWSNPGPWLVGFSRKLKHGGSCRIYHKEEQPSTAEEFKDEIGRTLQEKIGALESGEIDTSKVAALAVEEIMLRGAKLREAIDKTTKADVDLSMEKSIKEAANQAATSLMSEFKAITEDANRAVQVAKERALKAEEALAQKLEFLDGLYKPEAGSLALEKSIEALEKELEVTKAELQRLRVDAGAARARAEAAESRAKQAEAEVAEMKARRETEAAERAENFRTAIESLKSSAAARENAIKEAFQAQLAALQAAVEASETAKRVKEEANLRRFQAFERSLAVAEASIIAWKERALNTELQASGDVESGAGGRMANLLSRETYDSFLESGPRQDIPEWMKKRIQASLPGIPPRRYFVPDPEEELVLPDLSDVWSVAKAKVKPDDLYSKDAAAKEALQKQRRDLEQALETTIKRKKLSIERQEPGTGSGREIVFQGFNWESCRKRWYLDMAPKAADLSQSGITAVWLPPPTQSVSPQGYMPVDLYNLNSAYGTLEELKHCIQEMHKHDLLVLGDVVLNHRCAHSQDTNGIWNVFGGKLAWGPEAIVGDDPNFQGRGNPSSGDIFHAAPNIDHSQVFVRNDIKEYLLWLKREIGFDGWRLDFVRGFWGGYVKEYIESSEPAFAIGEYWDSLQYEGGNVSYNQDAHRQRIIDWINATGGTSSAFDVTTKGILHAALHNEYWRLIDPQQKPPGVMGWWPSRAVTFLENHDTGSTQGHWPFPRDKLMQGYAYILTHPGTPAVFYDHFYDFGLRDPIAELIAARKRVGIHSRSPVKIMHAVHEGYVAKVGENLVVKLGYLDWNPSKQNDLIGNWDKSIDHGTDYQVWEKR